MLAEGPKFPQNRNQKIERNRVTDRLIRDVIEEGETVQFGYFFTFADSFADGVVEERHRKLSKGQLLCPAGMRKLRSHRDRRDRRAEEKLHVRPHGENHTTIFFFRKPFVLARSGRRVISFVIYPLL